MWNISEQFFYKNTPETFSYYFENLIHVEDEMLLTFHVSYFSLNSAWICILDICLLILLLHEVSYTERILVMKWVLPVHPVSLLWSASPVVEITKEQLWRWYAKGWATPKRGKFIEPVQSPSNVPIIARFEPENWVLLIPVKKFVLSSWLNMTSWISICMPK